MPDLCVTTTGDPCVFPFTYKGVDYLECTYQDSPTPWCATMVDFSGKVITNRWGDCDTTGPSCSSASSQPANPSCITTGGPSSGRPCVFPFTYNGVTYRECAPPVASVTQPWCSTQTHPNSTHISGAGKYGTCPSSCPGGLASSSSSGSGVAGQGENCSSGATWTTACGQSCTCSPNGSPICSPCAPSCVTDSGPDAGSPCIFPFKWAGVTYQSCTPWTFGGVNQGRGWCSTKTDGLDNHVNGGGNYGFCSEACIPSVSTRPGIAFAVPEVNQRSNLRQDENTRGDAVVFDGPTQGRRPT